MSIIVTVKNMSFVMGGGGRGVSRPADDEKKKTRDVKLLSGLPVTSAPYFFIVFMD